VSFVASWAECNQTSKGRPRTPEAEVAGLREPGLDDQMRDRDPLLARGDRNNPIAREPPLAERIRVVARSGNNNFAVLGGSAVTSSHEVPVVDLGRAGAEHRGRRVVARRREFDRPPDGGDVEIRRLRGPLSDIR